MLLSSNTEEPGFEEKRSRIGETRFLTANLPHVFPDMLIQLFRLNLIVCRVKLRNYYFLRFLQ